MTAGSTGGSRSVTSFQEGFNKQHRKTGELQGEFKTTLTLPRETSSHG
jgi:hypothetical protein